MPTNTETLRRYLTHTFIETGTFQGNGTVAALDAGFQHVFTIEIYPPLYYEAERRFSNEPRVDCYLGSSLDRLPEILSQLHARATFWLDSHYCGGATGGAWETALIGELRQLKYHDINTHNILIDDVHLFGLDLPGLPEIEARLYDINPNYQLSYIQSGEPSLGLDILVAVVE